MASPENTLTRKASLLSAVAVPYEKGVPAKPPATTLKRGAFTREEGVAVEELWQWANGKRQEADKRATKAGIDHHWRVRNFQAGRWEAFLEMLAKIEKVKKER